MMQFKCFSKFELDTKKKRIVIYFLFVESCISFFSKDIIFYIIVKQYIT